MVKKTTKKTNYKSKNKKKVKNSGLFKRFLAFSLRVIEEIIDHKAFRPIAIVIIISFALFNGTLYIKERIIDFKEEKIEEIVNKPVKIRITDNGKVLDFDRTQIVERKVEQGDTVLNFLIDIGVNESDSFSILNALKKVYNPRSIIANNSIIAKYKVKINYSDEATENFVKMDKQVFIDELKIVISAELEYVVQNSGSANKPEFKAKKVKHTLHKKVAKYVGEIENGLFLDATKVGASPNAVMNMISLYGYSVDFQRDIRKGDKFEIVVETYYTKSGRRVKDGNILFSSLNVRGQEIEMYAYRAKNDNLSYYDFSGKSIKRSLLKTPVNGARISSGFGYRRHPILGYSRLHKGIDFAAPRGTPIFAAGDGTIVYRARNGGYGNFIKIRHNSRYQTAYAHISRFNRRFRKGSRVRQGDVIAYVGTTGRSTGPHLHYEVLHRGKAINPSRVNVASSKKLKGSTLNRFKEQRNKIDSMRKKTKENIA